MAQVQPQRKPAELDLETALRRFREHPELIILEPDRALYRNHHGSSSPASSRNASLPESDGKPARSTPSSSRKSSSAPLLGEKGETEDGSSDEPPDGGVLAWTQAVMGHLMYFNTWGYITSYGIFQTYETENLGISQADVAWVGALQIFLLFFVGTFSGRAFDAGLFHLVYPIGVVLQCAGVFATSCASRNWHFLLAQGLCTGLGAGMQYTPTMSLVASYFSSRKFFAIAFASCGSATGGVVFPILVKQLLPLVGFGWTLRVLGFVQLAFGLVTIAFFRPRNLLLKTAPESQKWSLVEWAAFREPTYVLYCGGIFCNFWALYFITDYITQFAEQYLNLGSDVGFTVLMVFSGIGVIGRLVPAYYADAKFGALNTVMPSVFVVATLTFLWMAVDNIGKLYAFVCIAGIAISSVYALATAALASLTTEPSKIGVRMGMAFTIGSFGALSGPVIGGQLITLKEGQFWAAQLWAAFSLLVTGFLFLGARFFKTGWVLKVKC